MTEEVVLISVSFSGLLMLLCGALVVFLIYRKNNNDNNKDKDKDKDKDKGKDKDGGNSGLNTKIDENASVLEFLNSLRARHGAPPLQYSRELSLSAQEWANTVGRDNKWGHSVTGPGVGESISEIFENSVQNDEEAKKQAIKIWYSEKLCMDWGNPGIKRLETGHFQMIMHQGATHVGIGIAKFNSGSNPNTVSDFVVLHISPVATPFSLQHDDTTMSACNTTLNECPIKCDSGSCRVTGAIC
jgi:hypothetical protein